MKCAASDSKMTVKGFKINNYLVFLNVFIG